MKLTDYIADILLKITQFLKKLTFQFVLYDIQRNKKQTFFYIFLNGMSYDGHFEKICMGVKLHIRLYRVCIGTYTFSR